MMVHNPLIRPAISWGVWHWGVPLDSPYKTHLFTNMFWTFAHPKQAAKGIHLGQMMATAEVIPNDFVRNSTPKMHLIHFCLFLFVIFYGFYHGIHHHEKPTMLGIFSKKIKPLANLRSSSFKNLYKENLPILRWPSPGCPPCEAMSKVWEGWVGSLDVPGPGS